MFILGVGTAAPRQRYEQRDCWEKAQHTPQLARLSPRSRAILKKILTGQNGIATRHLALNQLEDVFEMGPDALHARFRDNAPVLAAQAARNALMEAASNITEVDGLVISTCTGYLCPGLTSYVSELLGLRPDVLAFDLVGQGCGAAIPNLRAGEALLRSKQCRRVLSICVEVCSAAFFLDDDPGVLVSACLFGDGAGAAVLGAEPGTNRTVRWDTSASVLQPALRDELRFESRGGLLRNLLSPQVPELAADHVEKVLANVLARTGIDRRQLTGWVLHPGGRDVLTAVSRRLGLREKDVHFSAEVLREYGNLSSPSVYFVLQAALAESAAGGLWWMSSFGAGFSAHGAILEVGEPV